MSFLINPYAFLAAGGDFEPIATVTVGSGGASSIEFTSIPGTYQHLQVRGIGRTERALAATSGIALHINGSAGQYRHTLYGDGSAAYGASAATTTWQATFVDNNHTAGMMGAFVIDILDYASTSKAKVVRSFHGADTNGAGYVVVSSALWTSTSAVSSLKLPSTSPDNFAQYTTAALYGVKA